MRHRVTLHETVTPGVTPPEPGTTPLPAGRVRRFHVTQAPAETIARQGLRMSAAQGIEGPRGIYGWSTWKDAWSYSGGESPIVEYSITTAEAENHPVVVQRDIPPADIIAIHEPWHGHYRYAVANDVTPEQMRGLDAHYDKAADALEKRPGAITEDDHTVKLNALVSALKRHPLAGSIKLFGSATTDKARPGDIDCLLEADLDYINPDVLRLLSLANKYYPLLDPFYYWAPQRALFARNEYGNQWVRAKNTRAILRAGQAGVPVLDFYKTW